MARPSKVEKEKDVQKFPGSTLIVGKKKVGAKKRKSGMSKSKKRAIKEIKELCKKTTSVVPRTAYERLFREIANNAAVDNPAVRWKSTAIDMLITGTDAMIEDLMKKAAMMTTLRRAETLQVQDMKAVMQLDAMK